MGSKQPSELFNAPVIGWVYFVGFEDKMAPIKIGVCRGSVQKRVRELQIGNPYKLEVLASYQSEDIYKEERRLHEKFSHLVLLGEWFEYAEELEREINERIHLQQ